MTEGSAETPFIQQVLTVASLEILDLLRSLRALLGVVLYGGAVFGVGSIYLFVAEKIGEELAKKSPDIAALGPKFVFQEVMKTPQFQTEIVPQLERVGGARLIEALADGSLPLVLLVVLLVSTAVLPAVVLLTGYDRLSEDLHTKYARFVLQRVRREAWVLGKTLAHWLGSLALVVLVHVALTALATAFAPRFESAEVWAALPGIWAGMALFLLAYVGFVAIFSGAMGRPFAALAGGGVTLMALWLLKLIVPAVGAIWMGAWDLRLWLLEPLAVGVFAAHAVTLVGAAVLVVRARDL